MIFLWLCDVKYHKYKLMECYKSYLKNNNNFMIFILDTFKVQKQVEYVIMLKFMFVRMFK